MRISFSSRLAMLALITIGFGVNAHAQIHSAYMRVERVASIQGGKSQWESGWGSYSRDYSRNVKLKVEVRNTGNKPDELTAEWYFVAKTLAGGKLWMLDSGTKSLNLTPGQVEMWQIESKSVDANVEHFSGFQETYKRGSKIEGYLVVIKAGDKVVTSSVSSQHFQQFVTDPEALKKLPEKEPQRRMM